MRSDYKKTIANENYYFYVIIHHFISHIYSPHRIKQSKIESEHTTQKN